MGNPIISAAFPKVFDKRMREIFDDIYTDLTKTEDVIPQLFKMLDSNSAFEEFSQVGAVPDIPEFNGTLQYLPVFPGFYSKVEHKEFAGALQWERKFLDDRKFPVMMDQTAGLSTSAFRVRQKFAARQFANAFSSAFDFMITEEGTSWCSSAHTTKVPGVSTTSGFSNAGTLALDKASLQTTWLLFRQFRNDIGARIASDADLLVVPDSLGDKAEEIMGTPHGLYSAEGTINVQKGRFRVIRWKLLDDYTTKNWFIADSRMLKTMNMFIDRISPEFKTQVDFNTFMTQVSVYFRLSCGPLDWRTIFGNNVT